jgi:hypothetical protein
VFVGIGAETEQLGYATIEIAERIGIVKFALQVEFVALRLPARAAAEIADAVEGQNGSFFEGR